MQVTVHRRHWLLDVISGIAALFLALTLLMVLDGSAQQLPNKDLTPGATRNVTVQELCAKTTHTADVRHVTETIKRQVCNAYGVPRDTCPTELVNGKHVNRYEIDHLISLELGGDNVSLNLWPQPWDQARKKDVLENKLHALVCSGQVPLSVAQHDIATDWVSAYERYVQGKPQR